MARNTRTRMTYSQRYHYRKNAKTIMLTQDTCGICHRYVDPELKFPDPMAGVVDHILPINHGGHFSSLDNLQLAHNVCNNKKSDNLDFEGVRPKTVSERLYPEEVELL